MRVLLNESLYPMKKRNTEEYFETYKVNFLQETIEITRPSRNVNKILWWKYKISQAKI